MAQKHLKAFFDPGSVALIGASNKPHSVGYVLARNLLQAGFRGPVMPVNPHHQAVAGVLAYPGVADLPVVPELAVIATPAGMVPEIIDELGTRGTRAAVVVSAGFSQASGTKGLSLLGDLTARADRHGMRLVGPNSLGIMVPGVGLNASVSPHPPINGSLALMAQSGTVVTSIVDWAHDRGIGFSHLLSLGDMSDVDFGDMLDYLAADYKTRAILLYAEHITDARKFMSAARSASRVKPVIVVKSGRHKEGARAAASHSGALAGSDTVYDAAFRRAGMLRVVGLEELFQAVEILSVRHHPKGDRLAIVTNGGAIGVLATDALMDEGGTLARLSDQTLERLDGVLPPIWSRSNPIDVIGDADPQRYAAALEATFEDKAVDAALVLHCPTAISSGMDVARAVVEVGKKSKGKLLMASWVGNASAEAARNLLVDHHVPTYDTPEEAVHAFMYLSNYRKSRDTLMQTPPSVPEDFRPDMDQARAVILEALAQGRTWLTDPESKQVLAAYGVPIVPTTTVQGPGEAAAAAAEIDGPVALKIMSPDISHKSEVRGVVLDIADPEQVEQEARAMLRRVADLRPDARIDGLAVQPMLRKPGTYELIVGVVDDLQFGPTILFGQGGAAIEVIGDSALGLPPLNMRLARDLMEQTKVYRLLQGYQALPPVNVDAIAMTLIKVAQLVTDIGEVKELDINPLLADREAVFGLDTHIRIAPYDGDPADRLAIRPYPSGLQETLNLKNGRKLLLRPIVPEDEPQMHAAFARYDPEAIRLRFFTPMKALSHEQAARLTQIDYHREMALILVEEGIPGQADIHGVVRIMGDADARRAEYAIIVHHDLAGQGLGTLMMRRIIDHARQRGFGEIYGEVLKENRNMLALCGKLGFEKFPDPDDNSLCVVKLAL